MRKHHVYHLYADGGWEKAWEDHVAALKLGLILELDTFSVGLVGTESNRAIARKTVEMAGASVVIEETTGYEQVTLNWLHAFSLKETGAVFYAHSKGSVHSDAFTPIWRNILTFDTAVDWRNCVKALEQGFNCAGTNWHPAGEEWGDTPYFAGNFWWADLSFIRLLNVPSNETRFKAETWIGTSSEVNPFPQHSGSALTLPEHRKWSTFCDKPMVVYKR